jgi:signal peptidase
MNGGALLKNNVFIVAASLGVFITIFFKNFIFIYSFILLFLLYGLFHTKANGLTLPRKFFGGLFRYKRRRELKINTRARKKRFIERTARPKVMLLLLPVIIFIIIVYLFLSHTVFFAVVTSDSMNPALRTGDLVLMQSADMEINGGDIIMFSIPTEKNMVIHRVDGVTAEGIYTKGDATNATDDWVVNIEDVQAKVTEIGGNPIVLKGVGWYFIQNPPASAPTSAEMRFTSVMLITLKNIGIVLFMLCVTLYLLLTFRDAVNNHNGRNSRKR